MLKAYPQTKLSLCMFTCMQEYLQRTKSVLGSETGVFLTLVKPFKHASRDTTSGWIWSVMKHACVDVTQFKPHSARAASTLKTKAAAVRGVRSKLKLRLRLSGAPFTKEHLQVNSFLQISIHLSPLRVTWCLYMLYGVLYNLNL